MAGEEVNEEEMEEQPSISGYSSFQDTDSDFSTTSITLGDSTGSSKPTLPGGAERGLHPFEKNGLPTIGREWRVPSQKDIDMVVEEIESPPTVCSDIPDEQKM